VLDTRKADQDHQGLADATENRGLFDVTGRSVLITGGARGLGRILSGGFVAAGARVYISSREIDSATEAAQALSEQGPGTCHPLAGELDTEAGCRQLSDDLASRETSLDILINNAGLSSGAPMDQHDDEIWDAILAVNTKAVFHLTRFLLPLLQAAGTNENPARVINLGSVAGGGVSMRENYAYSASKAAVHHITRHLALRFGPTVAVNAIAPGVFASDMTAVLPEAFVAELDKSSPLRGIGRPDDIIGAALFLSSRASSHITGHVLPLDGGLSTTTW
jgi:NAD(P)-dependent dehydrogenase (short-subunit alcohol dehydrogenase family)